MTGNGYDAGDRVLKFGLPGDKAGSGSGTETVSTPWVCFEMVPGSSIAMADGYDAADVDPVFFGWGTDIPVPGDWDGDGKDSPGIYRWAHGRSI